MHLFYVSTGGLVLNIYCVWSQCLRHVMSFQKINEKPQVIADYESGRAIPNNQVMGKIERAIGKSNRLQK